LHHLVLHTITPQRIGVTIKWDKGELDYSTPLVWKRPLFDNDLYDNNTAKNRSHNYLHYLVLHTITPQRIGATIKWDKGELDYSTPLVWKRSLFDNDL
jgi:hypothetical protein